MLSILPLVPTLRTAKDDGTEVIEMAFVIVLSVLVAAALLAALVGVDSRPDAHQPPEPAWPFYRYRI